MKRPTAPNTRLRRLILCSACLGLAAAAVAQPDSPTTTRPGPPPAAAPDPNDGHPIREVRLLRALPGGPAGRTEPVDAAVAQLVRNQLRSTEGRPYSRQTVADDITRLNRLGRFRTIEADVQPQSDGSVVLTFRFAEQPLLQDVQVVGNRELSDQDILGALGLISGTPIDRLQIDRNARAIEDLYRAKGYYRVRVEVDEAELADSNIVVYRIIEGDRVRVTGVRFQGNRAFTARELRSAIRTTEYIPVFEQAPLDQDVLTEDVASLARFYRDRGYLDVRTSRTIQPSIAGSEAIITFEIEEGPLYNVRSVQVLYTTPDARDEYRARILKDDRAEVPYLTPDQMRAIGRQPLSDAQVTGLIPLKPGDVYSEDKLRKSLDAIAAAYGKLGSIREGGRQVETAFVDPQVIRAEEGPVVDVLLRIAEGQPTLTGEIKITGNTLTKQQVVLHEIQIRPDRPLDLGEVEESRRRLENLRLFQPGSIRLSVQPPDPADPGRRDVLVEVQETNTGKFNIGAVYDSDAGLVGRIALSQSNFDLFDVPETWGELFSGRAFRGAGQTASLEILPGTEIQTYSIALSDPTLLDSDYSASVQLFYRNRDQRAYDEERYGTRIGIGRRFGSVWTGRLALRGEWVGLDDIEPDRPVDVFKVADTSLLTGAGVEFVRTTVDDRNRPSRGSRLEGSIEQVGAMGGEFDFTKLNYQYTGFFNLYESFLGYKTILKLTNQISYIPQGQDAAPVYERYYLGGQSFRGFAYRGVSPLGIRNDTGTLGDDPVGGTFLFSLGVELNQPIYKDILSIAPFIDTGTVEEGFGFSHYRVSAGVGFRLYIRQLSPVPLAFDFGFPILKEPGDRERVFTFAIDLPF